MPLRERSLDPRRGRRSSSPAAVAARAIPALLALALAGCAASGLPAGAGHSGAPGATPTGTQSSTRGNGGPYRTPTPGGGTSLKPCPGGFGSVAEAGTPALVLGPVGATTGSVRPGALVQVQLPTRARWSYDGTAPAWALLQPAGYEDTQRQVCVWNFRASPVGTLTLKFTGAGLCDSKGSCPVPVIRETFTVLVA